MNFLIIATLGVGLVVDQRWLHFGQELVSVVVWGLLAVLWMRAEPRLRPAFLACLLIATAGECFLSLVWGLYEYRRGNIPLFVPPGHVLLFYLGMQISDHIPDGSEWWVAGLAGPLVLAYAWHGQDTLGLILYAFFFSCLLASPSRKLYATMFLLSLSLELYGTWMGNWVWPEQVPWLGLTQDNPPLASGAFYCVLDLLVVMATRRWVVRDSRGQVPCSSVSRVSAASEQGTCPLESRPFHDPASPMSTPSIASHQEATLSARSSSR